MTTIEAAIYGYAEKVKNQNSNATYMAYNIVVFDRSTNSVSRFSKRYSEFAVLHDKLRDVSPKIAAFGFPPKTVGLMNKNKLAGERKAVFNNYLKLILTLDPLPEAAKDFLQITETNKVVNSNFITNSFVGRLLTSSKAVDANSMTATDNTVSEKNGSQILSSNGNHYESNQNVISGFINKNDQRKRNVVAPRKTKHSNTIQLVATAVGLVAASLALAAIYIGIRDPLFLVEKIILGMYF